MDRHPQQEATFGTLIVDGSNRVAAAAARRAAESPGSSYNPLVVCGPEGVGKSHLLSAIAHLAREVESGIVVLHEPVDALVERLTDSIAAGTLDEFRDALASVDLLLLDDLEEAAGKARTQEELARIVDAMIARGAQLVITADRPPHEIPAFDTALAARLATGLTVDIAQPELPTRQALIERWLQETQAELSESAVDALAALPLFSVHALREAVDRVREEAEQRGAEPPPEEIGTLLGFESAEQGAEADEFGGFLSDISTAVAAVVETAPWRRRIAHAILRWEGEGIRTRRLEEALDADSAPNIDELLDNFARDVARLRQLRTAMDGTPHDAEMFIDPDRVHEAEALARDRQREATGADVPSVPASRSPGKLDPWYLDREKLAWNWLALDDRVMEEKG